MTREEAHLIQLLADVAELVFEPHANSADQLLALRDVRPLVEEQLKKLPQSIQEHGMYRPLVVRKA